MVSPAMRRRALGRLLDKGVSRRLGCKVVGLSRNASKAERKERRPELRMEILGLAEKHPRYGFRRVHALLPGVNLKAVHRIWREEGLSIKVRKRRRIQVERTPEEPPQRFGEVWAIDFASEWLENRRQARIVGILDVCTRENLLLKTQPSIRASHLVKELSWLFLVHGKPKSTGKDLQSHLTDYSDHYNQSRPHSALGGSTPASYRRTLQSRMEAEELTL